KQDIIPDHLLTEKMVKFAPCAKTFETINKCGWIPWNFNGQAETACIHVVVE
ncbi:unnamed protein product, partial [Dicrocoelium dendriticum]